MTEQMNVPKLRFDEFEGEWKKSIFKELVTLQRGSSPRPIIQYITKDVTGVNWIKIGDTKYNDKYIFKTKQKITTEGAKKSRFVSEGEIILSNSMSYGKPYILKLKGYIHDGWFVIRKFEKNFDKSYLIQILGSEWVQRQYQRLAAGGVVSNISSELVNAVKINLPPLTEQQKIASFLSKIDKKIELLTEKKAKLTEYKKGVMQQLFNGRFARDAKNTQSGLNEKPTFIPPTLRFKADDDSDFPDWEEQNLGSLGAFSGGGTPDTKISSYWGGDIPWISSSDVIDDNILKIKKTRFITKLAITESATKIVPANSILIVSRVGVGKFVVSNDEICTSQDFSNFTPVGLNITFIAYNLYFHKHKLEALAQGTSIKGFTTGDLKSLKLAIPQIEEQTNIANFLSAIDQKIELANSELEKAKQWKKGLLQQMFV